MPYEQLVNRAWVIIESLRQRGLITTAGHEYVCTILDNPYFNNECLYEINEFLGWRVNDRGEPCPMI